MVINSRHSCGLIQTFRRQVCRGRLIVIHAGFVVLMNLGVSSGYVLLTILMYDNRDENTTFEQVVRAVT